jgi:glycosyltransferase involved in cell wall biosynthesis
MMGEHLSVVMPVYNERYLVAEAVRRVLGVESPLIERLDLIVVDDGSTDGTRDILRGLAAAHPDRITYIEHERNSGKGAAVRTGIDRAQGSVTVIQDADLEYDPNDLPRLIGPFLHHGADAVFGSRFLTSEHRRVLYYRHRLGNGLLTFLSNLFTDLDLTDMETCYKAVRTPLLQSIPIRSNDFRLEPELTFKLAKRGARMFEVPISYSGRTYEEGKKIGFRDAVLAVGAMLRWWVIDDLYRADEHGSNAAAGIEGLPNLNRWTADVVRPYVGGRVLEIGAGIGDLTRLLVPRDRYTVSDVNPHRLAYLRNYIEGKPYLDVCRVDLDRAEDFEPLRAQYDTVICLGVLEHAHDPDAAVRNLRTALAPGGRAILSVPQMQAPFSRGGDGAAARAYSGESLARALVDHGFELETLIPFNRLATPLLWLNGRVLGRRQLGRPQLKLLNVMIGLFRRLDASLPWNGASLTAVARAVP